MPRGVPQYPAETPQGTPSLGYIEEERLDGLYPVCALPTTRPHPAHVTCDLRQEALQEVRLSCHSRSGDSVRSESHPSSDRRCRGIRRTSSRNPRGQQRSRRRPPSPAERRRSRPADKRSHHHHHTGAPGSTPSVWAIEMQQQQQRMRATRPLGPELQEWRGSLTRALNTRTVTHHLPSHSQVIKTLARSQVIALVCGIITAFLMVLALASSDWLLAVGWRQGLFEHCIELDAPKPLPFQINAKPGCHTARDEPYIMASAALCVICLLLDVIATVMTGLGLSNNDPTVKTRYYRIAVWVMTLALIAILVALILYPVFFAQELELGNRTLWEFGWAYGVGWGAAIFLFGAVVLLLCDQEEEEIYYKERTIIHAENDSRA
nr:uncharacterized protein LOC128704883 isoform X1 [Cherax quadricarinatus]